MQDLDSCCVGYFRDQDGHDSVMITYFSTIASLCMQTYLMQLHGE